MANIVIGIVNKILKKNKRGNGCCLEEMQPIK
jgi:hypothetical protein